MTMLNWLFERRPRLYDYEKLVIEAVCQNMSQNNASKFSRQLDFVSFIERSPSRRTIEFYARGRNRKRVEPFCLPGWPDEALLATVKLCDRRNPSHLMTADVFLVHGRLFSLEFSGTINLSAKDITVASVRICEQPQAPRVLSNLDSEVVRPLLRFGTITNPLAPVPKSELERFLKSFNELLPKDYCALLRLTDGFLINGWEILGTRMRKVEAADDFEFILAVTTNGNCSLLTKQGKRESPIIYLLFGDDEKRLGESFLDALASVLESKECS